MIIVSTKKASETGYIPKEVLDKPGSGYTIRGYSFLACEKGKCSVSNSTTQLALDTDFVTVIGAFSEGGATFGKSSSFGYLERGTRCAVQQDVRLGKGGMTAAVCAGRKFFEGPGWEPILKG